MYDKVLKVIVWFCFVAGAVATAKLWFTTVAALQLLLPVCDASMVTVPVPVNVTVLPLMVAGPETTRNDTGKPEDAVALIVNGGSP